MNTSLLLLSLLGATVACTATDSDEGKADETSEDPSDDTDDSKGPDADGSDDASEQESPAPSDESDENDQDDSASSDPDDATGDVRIATPIGGCAPSGPPYASSVDYSERFPSVPECAELLNCIFDVYCPSIDYDDDDCRQGFSAAWCRPEENSPSSYTAEVLSGECTSQYADPRFDLCRQSADAGSSDAGDPNTSDTESGGNESDEAAEDGGAAQAASDAASETAIDDSTPTEPDEATSTDDSPTETPELKGACAQLVALKRERVTELGCSGDDSEAVGRLCSATDSCMAELQAQVDCLSALDAAQWSCDTSDGHPQANGACEDLSNEYFACLQGALHEEDPFGCAQTAQYNDTAADALGCSHDTSIEGTCNQLNLRDVCLAEWDELVSCTTSLDVEAAYECADDEAQTLAVQAGVCESERSAFDGCIAQL